jgi:uncharacterized delta-60 repeat protein
MKSTTTRTSSAIALTLALLLGVAMGLRGGTAYAGAGDLDTTFGGGDGLVTTNFQNATDEARAVAVQADGKIVTVGITYITGTSYDFSVARYNPDGSPDTSFSGDGRLTTEMQPGYNTYDIANAVAIQSDGKTVAAGTTGGTFAAARYNSDGSLDTTFDEDGRFVCGAPNGCISGGESYWAHSATIQEDGKIILAGYRADSSGSRDFALVRVNPDGSLDNSFDGDGKVTTNFFGGDDEIRAVAIQAGRIVVAGNAQVSGINYDFALARYNPNGSLDTTFHGDGKVTTDFFGSDDGAYSMALQPDGKIVAAGAFHTVSSGYDFGLARYVSSGDIDTSFDSDGVQVVNFVAGTAEEVAFGVALQPVDGKIVAAGYAPVGGVNDFALVRLNPNGSLDNTFGGDGRVNHDFGGGVAIAYGVAIQVDRRIVTAGTADMGGTNNYDYALARYLSGLEPPPTPTNTPVPTQTPGEPTATPQATPTSCALQFPDVPPGSTFYDFVRCLACRDIISGYPDGNFGPGNPVTRGQLSKIVSNAAGYSENQANQSFEDVPTGSTFHQFIERLSSRGYISGYACGGAGEPCVPPGNLPYFRPNANVTRGQTSKIVASARGLPAPPPGLWTFQDVPQGSTFWEWIESLSSAGAITGYPCGGAGEPCVPPENRYYFRPNNQVTRGQSAKIVANAFFPGCQTP